MKKTILIAGPCVIESKEIAEEIASKLQHFAKNKRLDFYFKASFDKANRTSLESYRGPGMQKGLEILAGIKSKFGLKILTDIHEPSQAKEAACVADVLQIPAFLCRQSDLLVAAAKTKAKINIKKGQFMAPLDMKYSLLKVLQTRGFKGANPTYEDSKKLGVFLAERGSSFGYNNLVVDMRALPIMRGFAPVIYDATHSVQMPGGGACSGGDASFIAPLSSAAAAAGVDGFFYETHTDPAKALCDGPNMIKIDDLEKLIEKLLKIQEIK